MNFTQSIKTCFRKYANFKGRAMRSEFWWFQLLIMIAAFGALGADLLLLGYSVDDVVTPITIIVEIGLLVPTASVMARRLHDIGWSGWVQLPVFLEFAVYLDIWFPDDSRYLISSTLLSIGALYWLILVILLIRDSQPKSNKYGPNPKAPEMGEVFS